MRVGTSPKATCLALARVGAAKIDDETAVFIRRWISQVIGLHRWVEVAVVSSDVISVMRSPHRLFVGLRRYGAYPASWSASGVLRRTAPLGLAGIHLQSGGPWD